MVDIVNDTVLIVQKDGTTQPFDADHLSRQLAESARIAGVYDPEMPDDIALSIEYTLRQKSISNESPCFDIADIDYLIFQTLVNVGYGKVDDVYRKNSFLLTDHSRIPIHKVNSCIEENLDIHGSRLELIAKKVINTMQAIGARDSSEQLIRELAKHFLRQSTEHISPDVLKHPDFQPDKASTIRFSELLPYMPPSIQNYFDKRILSFHPVSLHIFPVLRLNIRLTGIATSAALEAPLTELTLSPELIKLAGAVDRFCLLVDQICVKKGYADNTPVKLMLSLGDASVFTRDWMACSNHEAQEACAVSLCEILYNMLTRQPVKMTCI